MLYGTKAETLFYMQPFSVSRVGINERPSGTLHVDTFPSRKYCNKQSGTVAWEGRVYAMVEPQSLSRFPSKKGVCHGGQYPFHLLTYKRGIADEEMRRRPWPHPRTRFSQNARLMIQRYSAPRTKRTGSTCSLEANLST